MLGGLLEESYCRAKNKKPKHYKSFHHGGTYKKSTRKIGRNESCLCGSGKKFKKCCIKKSSKLYIPKK